MPENDFMAQLGKSTDLLSNAVFITIYLPNDIVKSIISESNRLWFKWYKSERKAIPYLEAGELTWTPMDQERL